MQKIVIIEDELAIAGMYEVKLETLGYTVKVAHDGESGLKLIESFQPDLILLDLHLPAMQGDEVLEQLRQSSWGANVRVIILTNISKDEAPSRLRFLGVDRYVVKAHQIPTQVTAVVGEILGRKVQTHG